MIQYSSESALADPKQFTRDLIRDLRSSRYLISELFVRELRRQYRRSVLGYLWILLPPIATTIIWVIIFNAGILNISVSSGSYLLYVLINITVWETFTSAFAAPSSLLDRSQALISKVQFPSEALLVSGLAEVGFKAAVRLSVVLAALILLGVGLRLSILVSLVGFVSAIFLGFGLGLICAPLGVLYTDLRHFLPLLLSGWFFATPIFYLPPTAWPYKLVVYANPVTPIIVTTRELLLGSDLSLAGLFVLCSILSVAVVFFGAIWFRVAKRHLVSCLAG